MAAYSTEIPQGDDVLCKSHPGKKIIMGSWVDFTRTINPICTITTAIFRDPKVHYCKVPKPGRIPAALLSSRGVKSIAN
jgi:hypothetical protein